MFLRNEIQDSERVYQLNVWSIIESNPVFEIVRGSLAGLRFVKIKTFQILRMI